MFVHVLPVTFAAPTSHSLLFIHTAHVLWDAVLCAYFLWNAFLEICKENSIRLMAESIAKFQDGVQKTPKPFGLSDYVMKPFKITSNINTSC